MATFPYRIAYICGVCGKSTKGDSDTKAHLKTHLRYANLRIDFCMPFHEEYVLTACDKHAPYGKVQEFHSVKHMTCKICDGIIADAKSSNVSYWGGKLAVHMKHFHKSVLDVPARESKEEDTAMDVDYTGFQDTQPMDVNFGFQDTQPMEVDQTGVQEAEIPIDNTEPQYNQYDLFGEQSQIDLGIYVTNPPFGNWYDFN